MAYPNINSLCTTNQLLDILAINESKLSKNDCHHLFSLEGYTIVRRDQNKYGGGVYNYLRIVICYSQ